MTPYFKTFGDFLAMGGHGFYVWLCYAMTFLAVIGLIIYAKNERKQTLDKLGRQQAQSRLTNKQRKQS
ncbi:heme exporter protein CcmD [Moraxella sp. FZLJ2107]|uniref:Heme exporter protein D n=1 Tax=Moraxella porci DSM 25326 TaxID=573983 RepID=A0A1T0CR25_9GAMM|nr:MULTISPECIES: heme exporter protein CcmD [Moraxella]OOS24764.1 heme exporter protein CcmD [Moraxella porci DSM 25326]USZ15482.1 heme exporter protein CcmD [Moraxella sp. FZFQ2102]UTO04119.1 heme exporter protein CcmD [Moraxella sp. FZLJ2107]UTO22952.1 heme exporter protein CcmD [Moraxella sp. FZLJ2109]